MARISNWHYPPIKKPTDEEMVSEDFMKIYGIIQNYEIDTTEKVRLILKETKLMIRDNKIYLLLNK
jgi:hypothetical protein